jgi:hypothetical protein
MRAAAPLLPFDAPLVRRALVELAPAPTPPARVDVARLFDQTLSRRESLLRSVERVGPGSVRLDALTLLNLTREDKGAWKWLRLVVDDTAWDYPRAFLRRCRVTLKPFYGSLTARIEQDRGLRFAWRLGKGGLILHSDPVAWKPDVLALSLWPQVKP